jgi:hypothetical protein
MSAARIETLTVLAHARGIASDFRLFCITISLVASRRVGPERRLPNRVDGVMVRAYGTPTVLTLWPASSPRATPPQTRQPCFYRQLARP